MSARIENAPSGENTNPQDSDVFPVGSLTGQYVKFSTLSSYVLDNVFDSDITFTDITTGNADSDQHGFLPKLSGDSDTWLDGKGGWTTPNVAIINTYQVDCSGGTSDTYGVLAGTINGVNTTYTVSAAVYVTGTLKVYLNGQLQTQGTGEDWTETTPASGTFDFVTAPVSGDIIVVEYLTAASSPLTPDLGGTGVANAAGSTLTLGGATTISTGGTIALGGYTLTVPATGTAALLATANVFTTTQTITPGTDVVGLVLDKSTSADALQVKNGATVLGGIDSSGRLQATMGTHFANFFAGLGAGNTTNTGEYNTGVGRAVLTNLTSGNYNAGLGNFALNKVTTGSYNFGLGSSALATLTTKSDNTAIGTNALFATTGERNTAIGSTCLSTTTGSRNVGLGFYAGQLLTTASGCIFLGTSAGRRQTNTSSLLVIDNVDFPGRASAAEEAQNAFLYGSMAAGGFLQLNIPTTTNNAVKDTLKLQAYVSTASTGAAAGFGVGLPFLAETATDGTYQQQGLISTEWIDATNVSRKAKMSLSAYDTAARLGLEIEADGSAAKIGVLGASPIVRQAHIVDADGTLADVTSKFNSLLAYLENFGFIATA